MAIPRRLLSELFTRPSFLQTHHHLDHFAKDPLFPKGRLTAQQFLETGNVEARGAFQGGANRIFEQMLSFSRAAKPRALSQVQHDAFGGSEQVVHDRMAFVPGTGMLGEAGRASQRLVIYLQLFQGNINSRECGDTARID
jgi:hypothetical protein